MWIAQQSYAASDSRFFYTFDDDGQFWPVDELAFFLVKGLGWSYDEIMNMPVTKIRWYADRLKKQIEAENRQLQQKR